MRSLHPILVRSFTFSQHPSKDQVDEEMGDADTSYDADNLEYEDTLDNADDIEHEDALESLDNLDLIDNVDKVSKEDGLGIKGRIAQENTTAVIDIVSQR